MKTKKLGVGSLHICVVVSVALTAGLLEVVRQQAAAQDAKRKGTAKPTGKSAEFAAIEKELESRWKDAELPSVSVGIVRGGDFVYAKSFGLADQRSGRAATPETLYRIGSITKVMTTTLLMVLRDQGVVALDDPVAKYLPSHVKLPSGPAGSKPITLRHLATHSSGLPRLPVNLAAKGEDPYGGYSLEQLYEGLAKTELEAAPGTREQYSNLGSGLLGHALERAAGEPYEELLRKHIFAPLGMKNTTIAISPRHQRLLAQGYLEDSPKRAAVDWDLGTLAPAGAVASSINDMAKFLAVQLRASESENAAGSASVPAPLSSRLLAEMHEPQKLADGSRMQVGMGWVVQPFEHGGSMVWHNGGMAGYHSFLAFAPKHGVGVIVLTNSGKDIDALGAWLLSAAVRPSDATANPQADPAIREIAEALAKYFVAQPPDSMATHFHDQFLAQIPITQIKPLFADIHRQFGRCEGVEVASSGRPRAGTIRFKFARNRTVRGEIELDGSNPPKIVSLLLRP